MNIKIGLLVAGICFVGMTRAQKIEMAFDVIFNEKKIGMLKAYEERIGDRFLRDLRTNTDAKVMIMAVHVEAEVSTTHQDGAMVRGVAYRHANRGSEDVHAIVTKIGDRKYTCERNGGTTQIDDKEISFCVIDLYFREPKNMTQIFSTMHATFVPIRVVSPGKYKVTTPDKRDSYYSYRNGVLVMIETETPLGTVTSKRT